MDFQRGDPPHADDRRVRVRSVGSCGGRSHCANPEAAGLRVEKRTYVTR